MSQYETNEKLKIQKFIFGLNPKIKIMVNLHQFKILQKAYDMAQKEKSYKNFRKSAQEYSIKDGDKGKKSKFSPNRNKHDKIRFNRNEHKGNFDKKGKGKGIMRMNPQRGRSSIMLITT